MNWSPDPETLQRLREVSRQQVREFLAKERQKRTMDSVVNGKSKVSKARKHVGKSAADVKSSRATGVK